MLLIGCSPFTSFTEKFFPKSQKIWLETNRILGYIEEYTWDTLTEYLDTLKNILGYIDRILGYIDRILGYIDRILGYIDRIHWTMILSYIVIKLEDNEMTQNTTKNMSIKTTIIQQEDIHGTYGCKACICTHPAWRCSVWVKQIYMYMYMYMYTVSQLNWYLFCFWNKSVNFKTN